MLLTANESIPKASVKLIKALRNKQTCTILIIGSPWNDNDHRMIQYVNLYWGKTDLAFSWLSEACMFVEKEMNFLDWKSGAF